MIGGLILSETLMQGLVRSRLFLEGFETYSFSTFFGYLFQQSLINTSKAFQIPQLHTKYKKPDASFRIRLSILWALRDLNPRPSLCKSAALPTELSAHKFALILLGG